MSLPLSLSLLSFSPPSPYPSLYLPLFLFLFSSAGQQVDLGQRHLKVGIDDPLLTEISKEFFDFERLQALAAQLLQGVGKGGYAFVRRHTVRGGVPDPVPLTREVLYEWIQEKPSVATRGALYEVLRKVNPAAAVNFRSKLLGDP